MTDAFLKAVEEVKLLKQKPDYAVLGEVYGLYKQATVGDVNTERPGVLDMAGRGKWAAWHKQKGMSKEDAMAAYVELVEQLKARDGS